MTRSTADEIREARNERNRSATFRAIERHDIAAISPGRLADLHFVAQPLTAQPIELDCRTTIDNRPPSLLGYTGVRVIERGERIVATAVNDPRDPAIADMKRQLSLAAAALRGANVRRLIQDLAEPDRNTGLDLLERGKRSLRQQIVTRSHDVVARCIG
ncbi:hypothetical protein QCE73_20670 [Caballeronia sp. LZ029]|nr:hypothetical protein [Caballeronia sp. LZ029]MDR5745580.1 hypothetical protein [Caballeronia sp. LZ029]